jgi:hypothetical protein
MHDSQKAHSFAKELSRKTGLPLIGSFTCRPRLR